MTYLHAFISGMFFAGLVGVVFLVGAPWWSAIAQKRQESGRAPARGMRVGGVVIALAIIAGMYVHAALVIDRGWVVFIGMIIVACLVGVIDDVRALSWRAQIIVQCAIAGLLVASGYGIHAVSAFSGATLLLTSFGATSGLFIGLILTIVWSVLIVNAFNWADGIDGLAGGVAVIAFVTLAVLALRPEVSQPPFAIVALICAGAVLVFTCINAASGRMILGTSGTYVIGFALALLAIFAGGKIGTTLLVLAVPLCDAVYVIWQRFSDGVSIVRPDRRHLHHHLLARGWHVRHIRMLYYSLTLVGALLALAMPHIHNAILFVLYGGVLVLFLSCVVLPSSRDHQTL